MSVFSWMGQRWGLNNFAKHFATNRSAREDIREKQIVSNSVGQSQEEMDGFKPITSQDIAADFFTGQVLFNQIFTDKKSRVSKYREMSLYPEISDAIDIIVDDAIISDSKGDIVHLKIKKEIPKPTERIIKREWNYIVNDVLKFHDNGYELFKKWLIESELYLEMVLNKKGNSIISVKPLPSFTTMPIYNGSYIAAFLQSRKDKTGKDINVPFEPNQVAYINYGIYGNNLVDVRGYLESAIRTYNQLKNLEDALVVYRLVRAPERRVWNIDVGRMPKGKAEEYIKKLINKYKKQSIYDPATGAINSSQNIQALTEDYWFAKSEGKGTEVTPLQSGMNLGELEDVNYFLRKLYKTLKMPRSRWEDPGSVFGAGKIGEITREEIKFARFIERLQSRFKKMIIDVFFQQLKFKDIEKKYISSEYFDIGFTASNLFKEYKELELLETKFGIWDTVSQHIYSEDNTAGSFSREYALRNFFGMTEEQYDQNLKLVKIEAGRKFEDMLTIDDKLAGKTLEPIGGDEDSEEESPGETEDEPESPPEGEGEDAEPEEEPEETPPEEK